MKNSYKHTHSRKDFIITLIVVLTVTTLFILKFVVQANAEDIITYDFPIEDSIADNTEPEEYGGEDPGDLKISIRNGWFAEDLGNGMYYIYDENNNPLGYATLGEDDDLYTYDFRANMIQLSDISAINESITTNEKFIEPAEENPFRNPETGDFLILSFITLIASGIIMFFFIRKPKKKDKIK